MYDKLSADRAYYQANRERRIKQTSAWKKANRLRATIAKYGLTVEDYKSILRKQGGGCAICGTKNPRDRRSKYFRVDHCHKSGKVRGLLCSPCNVAIGMMKESPDRLRAAARYCKGFRDRRDV